MAKKNASKRKPSIVALSSGIVAGLALTSCCGDTSLPAGSFTMEGPTQIEVEAEFPEAFHPDFRITTAIETGGDLSLTSTGACTQPSTLGPNELYQLTVADVGTCTITAVQAATTDYRSSQKQHIVEVVRETAP